MLSRRVKRLSVNLLGVLLLLAGLLGSRTDAMAAPFTPGNFVVVRVGAGSVALANVGTAVFLDEYTPAGVLVQSIALPTTATTSNTGAAALTLSGVAGSEGYPNLSTNGSYLSLTGYNISTGGTAGAASSVTTLGAAANNRVVVRVAADGSLDTSTRLADGYSGTNIRSAVTTDGSGFWTSGATGGVRYAPFGNDGATASTTVSLTPNNNRVVSIANGQLYVSSSTSTGTNYGISTVGSGLPTNSGNTNTIFVATPTTSSVYQSVFFDLDPNVPGVDVLYLTDSNTGIQKYTYNGTSWAAQGTITFGYAGGLMASRSAMSNAVTIYAASTSAAGGSVVSFTDPNTTLTGSIAGLTTTTIIPTSGTNKVFRGLSFVPQTAPSPQIFVSNAGTPTALAAGSTPYATASSPVVYYDVSGRYLTAAITVTAPADYEVSLTSTNGFGPSLTTPTPGPAATGGLVPPTRIYVRLKGTNTGVLTGTVANVSGSASQTVAVSGTVIAPTISTGIVGGPVCVGQSGASISVPFTSNGNFDSGNVFSVELSTAAGTFPGTGLATTSSTSPLTATVPAGTTSAGTYRLRVNASSPAINGSNNGTDLSIVNYQTTQVANLTPAAGDTQETLAWNNPASCVSHVVVVTSAGSAVTAVPAGAFTASAQFGSGTNLGTAANPNYVMYDGTGTSLKMMGLTNNTTYYSAVFVSNGDGYGPAVSTSSMPVTKPLPVELSGFTAARLPGGVALRWTTASEKNSDYFEVQRSPDGSVFSPIATVAGQGNSTRVSTYASLDRTAPAGAVYYRLREVDRDGETAFSPVLRVSSEALGFLIFPNPARATISFQTSAEASTTYRILNQLGQALRTGQTPPGVATLPVNDLLNGCYFLELQTEQGRVIRKFEKE